MIATSGSGSECPSVSEPENIMSNPSRSRCVATQRINQRSAFSCSGLLGLVSTTSPSIGSTCVSSDGPPLPIIWWYSSIETRWISDSCTSALIEPRLRHGPRAAGTRTAWGCPLRVSLSAVRSPP